MGKIHSYDDFINESYYSRKIKPFLRRFQISSQQEIEDIKKVAKIMAKYATNSAKNINKKEKNEDVDFIKLKIKDSGKMAALAAIWLIPGGSLILPASVAFAKKLGVELRPSNFTPEKSENRKLNEFKEFDTIQTRESTGGFNYGYYGTFEFYNKEEYDFFIKLLNESGLSESGIEFGKETSFQGDIMYVSVFDDGLYTIDDYFNDWGYLDEDEIVLIEDKKTKEEFIEFLKFVKSSSNLGVL